MTLSLSTAIVCNELSAIENGMISYSPDSEGPEYDLSTMATYSCNDGFVLVGPNEVRICEDVGTGALGEFSDEAPTCERECMSHGGSRRVVQWARMNHPSGFKIYCIEPCC